MFIEYGQQYAPPREILLSRHPRYRALESAPAEKSKNVGTYKYQFQGLNLATV